MIKLKSLRKIESEITGVPRVGEILQGKIITHERNTLFLDLGAKGIGIVYGKELHNAQNILKKLKTDIVITKLLNLENEDGYRELSIIDAMKDSVWQELKALQEQNKTIEAKIIKATKGGLIAEVNGILGFLPLSYLSQQHYPNVRYNNRMKILQDLQKFINKILKVKIIDLDPKKENLILSEKTINKKLTKSLTTDNVKKFKIGDIVEGKISGLTNFGAFVELKNNVEGLLYSSEISDKKEDKLEDILKLNQKIKAKVIKITDNQVYLSLKNL